jgi:hypothetical protein
MDRAVVDSLDREGLVKLVLALEEEKERLIAKRAALLEKRAALRDENAKLRAELDGLPKAPGNRAFCRAQAATRRSS